MTKAELYQKACMLPLLPGASLSGRHFSQSASCRLVCIT